MQCFSSPINDSCLSCNNYCILHSTYTITFICYTDEPAIGDIKLAPTNMSQPGYYLPLVYFTDGIEPAQWGAICYDKAAKNDGIVICNQLGYEFVDFMGG